jgi:hypothetical protein
MNKRDPLSGVWYSGVGSQLKLEVSGSKLKGFFHSTEGPKGKYALVGSVDPDPSLPNRALSFSVSWIRADTDNDQRSVTSYTGQYHRYESDDEEAINTIFLLADETSPRKQFASTFVGYDNFARERPSAKEIDKERKRRR